MRHSVSSSQPPIIETERLILRVEEEADAPAVRELLLDPEGRKFTGGAIERSLDEIREDIRNNASRFSLQVENVLTGNGHCCFGVLKKPDLTYIGYCGIRFCSVMKEVELLYGYRRPFWGKGFATEAANAVLDFGLSKIRLPAVFAAVHPLNPASEQVIVKCGMRYLREIEWPKQGNVRLFGITAEEHKKRCGTGRNNELQSS